VQESRAATPERGPGHDGRRGRAVEAAGTQERLCETALPDESPIRHGAVVQTAGQLRQPR